MLNIRTLTVCLPTPRSGIQLAGYSSRRTLTAVDQPLHASFICIQDSEGNDIVLGSIDTLFVSPQFLKDLGSAGAAGRIVLFSTHTHNAPSLARELPLLGEVDENWYRQVVKQLAFAIENLRNSEAINVSVSYGEKLTNLNINRRKRKYVLNYKKLLSCSLEVRSVTAMTRNANGPVDHRVRLFSFDTISGTRAVLWSFAAHAAFFPEERTLSPDFPGLVHEELREMLGSDCCLLYIPGLAGSAIPNAKQRLLMPVKELLMRALPLLPMLPSYSISGYKRWVHELKDEFMSAYRSRLPIKHSSGLDFHERIAESIFIEDAKAQKIDLKVSYIALGDDAGIIAYNGEMLCEWAEYLDRLPLGHIILSGYAGGPCLYIPTTKQVAEGGYEVDRFQQHFNLSGTFAGDITERVMQATKGVLGNVVKHRD